MPWSDDKPASSPRRLGMGMVCSLVVVVLALAVIGWALHRSLRAIDVLVERIVEVEEPMRAAAHEMEINVLGCGLAVWKYLGTGAPEHRERVQKDRADFQRFRAEYGRLAATPLEHESADRLDPVWASYSSLCDTLMATRDQYSALLAQVTAAIDEIDRIVDERIQPAIAADAPGGGAKLLASTAIEADVAEIGAAVGAFVADPSPRYRELVLAATGEARDRVAAFLQLPLSPAEREHGERVRGLVQRVADGLEQGVSLYAALRDHASTFIGLRGQLDEVLDEGIQILTQRQLAAAHPRTRAAIDRQYTASLFLLGLGAVLSIGAIVLLAYRSVEIQAANRSLHDEVQRRQQAESARTQLFADLVSAQEQERGRLARELHDQMGQNLSALRLGLKSLSRAQTGEPAAAASAQLVELQSLTGSLIEQVHFIAWELRPAALDELGLHGALSSHLDDWMRRSGVKVDFESNMEGRRLPEAIEIALYRVAQEALDNVLKHAHAGRVSVTVQQRDNEVVMVVEDDGCGFDADADRVAPPTRAHLGLQGMRERTRLAGGRFDVESAPGAGTSLIVRLPMPGLAGTATP